MTPDPRAIADRIERERKLRGWSLAQLAREAKLHRTHGPLLISRFATSDRPTAQLWVAAQIAEALEVTLDWLVFGRGPKRSTPRVEEDPLYPSRAGVLAACYSLGLSEDVVARLRGITGLVADPGTRFWLDQALALRDGVAGLLPAPAPPLPASPAEREPKRAKRTRKK